MQPDATRAVVYRQAMERLYIACIAISAVALLAITAAIPYGVFMRYVVNSAASWPEPFSVLLMVLFSFVGGAAVYRANVHIGVQALVNAVPPGIQRFFRGLVHIAMGLTAAFMVGYGAILVHTTWPQSIPEFPGLSVGITYLPIPIGGFLTLLFIIELVWLGPPPESSVMYADKALELE